MGDPDLDGALRGGIKKGTLTEIAGEHSQEKDNIYSMTLKQALDSVWELRWNV